MRPLSRQSRHPLQLGQMVGIIVICAWQILSGPERHLTVWHVPEGSYLPLALVALVGCLCSLVAAVSADSWTAGAFELTGAVMLSAVLSVDLVSVITTTHYPDTDIVTGLLGGLVAGLLWRIGSISRDVLLVIKDQRSPPFGDLDLLAATKVDSATALVVGSESIGAHAAELKALEQKGSPK